MNFQASRQDEFRKAVGFPQLTDLISNEKGPKGETAEQAEERQKFIDRILKDVFERIADEIEKKGTVEEKKLLEKVLDKIIERQKTESPC